MSEHLVQVTQYETEVDSGIEVVGNGGATLYLSFDEAIDLAQQLADMFGTFAGPASMRREDPNADPEWYIRERAEHDAYMRMED